MVYRFKVTLPESKVFFRIFAVGPQMTLFEFHSFICSELRFDPDQMVFFDGRDSSDTRKGRYCLFDMGDGSMDQITLKQLVTRGEVMLRYYFDMRLKRYLIISFEAEEEEDSKMEYPGILDGKGDTPGQFSKYVDPEPVDLTSKKTRFVDDEDLDDEDEEDEDEDDDEDDEEEDDDEDGKLLVDEDFGKE